MTTGGTFETATRLAAVRGRLSALISPVKLEVALRAFHESVDTEALLAAIDVAESDVVTPLMFQYRVFERARADRRRVVLPEGEDERILRATAILTRLAVADLILLGDEAVIRAKAAAHRAWTSAPPPSCRRTTRSWSPPSPRNTPGCARTRA